MTDRHVLDMPVSRFWAMEKNIDRIPAAKNLREIATSQAGMNGEAAQRLQERLVLEIGETCKIKRAAVVKGDPDRAARMRKLMG